MILSHLCDKRFSNPSSRLVFAASLIVTLIFEVPSIADQKSRSVKAPSPSAACSALLGGGSAVPSRTMDRYIALLELGLRNFSLEQPEFSAALQRTLESDQPINPFLNISTALGSALSGQTEVLLNDLQSDWPLVQDWIRDRTIRANQDSEAREQDTQQTQPVLIYEQFKFEGKDSVFGFNFENNSGPIFLMQTDSHYFVAGEIASDGPNHHDVGIYSISKKSRKVKRLALIDAVVEDSINFWEHDGFIYGFGRHLGDRLFQFDPRTGKTRWSRFEMTPNHAVFRIPTTNVIVGLVFSGGANSRVKGEIRRFVSGSLALEKKGIPFEVPVLECLFSPEKKRCIASLASDFWGEPWIQVGTTIRTDGATVAYKGTSEAWFSFAPMDRFQVRFKKADSRRDMGLMDMQITEVTNSNSKGKSETDPVKIAQSNGRSVSVRFPYHNGYTYKLDCQAPLASGSLLCHVVSKHSQTGQEGLVGIWLLDPQSFSIKPVSISWPDRYSDRWNWEFVRNANKQQLLQVMSAKGDDVELWLLSEAEGEFKKVFERKTTDDGQIVSSAGVQSLVDYKALSFVGWKADESLYLEFEAIISRGN